jgi:hypothetical protein
MSIFRNTEPSLVERIVLKALAKLTFSMNGLRVDGSGATQPVSGTVTSNIGTGTLAGVTTVTTVTQANIAPGRYNLDGASLQASYMAFQSGYRRNIAVS